MPGSPKSNRRSAGSRPKTSKGYVCFSDKLTESMDNISAMIREL